MPHPYRITGTGSITGTVSLPGDKSLSHRALILNGIARGTRVVTGLNRGEDVGRTRALLASLGVGLRELEDGAVEIAGRGRHLSAPLGDCDCGNSGTTARLMAGILAGQSFTSCLTGDASLRARPMLRIVEPLRRMGARVEPTAEGTLPLRITGGDLRGIEIENSRRSAQVKGCILLAGLYAEGATRVHEAVPTRDHTERLLWALGASIEDGPDAGGGHEVIVRPGDLTAKSLAIPGDPSAAAFLIVAATILPSSAVTCERVLLNPGRTAYLGVLERMGARLFVEPLGTSEGGEPLGRIRAETSGLRGVAIGPDEVPALIDEIPILAVAASCAEGDSVIEGVGELRAKETDRIEAIRRLLDEAGIAVRTAVDRIEITGGRPRAGSFTTGGDHRTAMAAVVLGAAAAGESEIDDVECAGISFPGFRAAFEACYRPPAR